MRREIIVKEDGNIIDQYVMESEYIVSKIESIYSDVTHLIDFDDNKIIVNIIND